MEKNHLPIRRTPRRRMRVLVLAGAASTVGLWLGLHSILGLHVNVTPSLPYGLYRLTKAEPAPGQLVRACLPEEPSALALARGYVTVGNCPYGTGFVAKVLAARGGDVVRVTHVATYVNGRALPNSALQPRDSGGRVMPAALGRHVLKQGETWLYAGYNEKSWDSRYYGPVPDSLLRGVVVPLWTWGAPYDPAGLTDSDEPSHPDDGASPPHGSAPTRSEGATK